MSVGNALGRANGGSHEVMLTRGAGQREVKKILHCGVVACVKAVPVEPLGQGFVPHNPPLSCWVFADPTSGYAGRQSGKMARGDEER